MPDRTEPLRTERREKSLTDPQPQARHKRLSGEDGEADQNVFISDKLFQNIQQGSFPP